MSRAVVQAAESSGVANCTIGSQYIDAGFDVRELHRNMHVNGQSHGFEGKAGSARTSEGENAEIHIIQRGIQS